MLKALKPEKAIPSSLLSLLTKKGGLPLFFTQNPFTVDQLTQSEAVLLVIRTTSSQDVGRYEKQSVGRFCGT